MRGAESYDCQRVWPSINHSILSDLQVFNQKYVHKYCLEWKNVVSALGDGDLNVSGRGTLSRIGGAQRRAVGVALRMEEVKSYLILQLIGALKRLPGQLDWQGISWIGLGNRKGRVTVYKFYAHSSFSCRHSQFEGHILKNIIILGICGQNSHFLLVDVGATCCANHIVDVALVMWSLRPIHLSDIPSL